MFPQSLGDRERINLESFPPGDFIASLMQLPMVATAERYCELIADFQANGSRLREPQMMRVARLAAANEAWLNRNEFEMRFVAQSLGLGNGELALVNATRNRLKVCWNKRRG